MVDAQARRPTVRHLDEGIAIRPRDRNPHAASSVILADPLCRPDSGHAGTADSLRLFDHRRGAVNAPFLKVINAIEVFEGPHNTIVHKATYQISGGTVLLDPEMVVAFFHAEVVARLCAEYHADAFVAGWERVSEISLRSTSTPAACLQRSF